MTWRTALGALLVLAAVGTSTATPPATAPATLPATGDLRGPIHGLTWETPPADCANLTPFVWVREDTFPETAAALSRKAPPGRAGLFFWAMTRDLMRHPRDRCRTPDGETTRWNGVWPDRGTEQLKGRAEFFFRRYHAAGGRLDYLVLDHEDGRPMWGMPEAQMVAIAADPRAAGLRQALGFDDLTKAIRWRDGPEYLEWNALTGKIVADALNAGLFEPARQYYPDARGSNYGMYVLAREHVVPDLNGHLQTSAAQFGTHGSPNLYGEIGGLASKPLVPGSDAPYGDAPFGVLRHHVNLMRAVRRSSPAPVRPWISHKTYASSRLRDNGYYEELIYHLGLCGADGLLVWNPGMWKEGLDPRELRTWETDRIIDRCLAELNRRFGDAPRATVTPDAVPWDSSVIATAMRIGGGDGGGGDARVLWRVTVPPDTVGVRVHPGGDVLDVKDGLGVWYESKPDVRPTFEPM
jgi:hypothetical protein